MNDKFETASGVVLELKPVSQIGLEELLYRLGFHKARTIEAVQEKADKGGDNYNEAVHQLFGFCCGLGVTTNPPEDKLEEMRGLGMATEIESVCRLAWLRWFIIQDQQEAGRLVGAIMALTFEDRAIGESPDKE